jgi:hypothetical protein
MAAMHSRAARTDEHSAAESKYACMHACMSSTFTMFSYMRMLLCMH